MPGEQSHSTMTAIPGIPAKRLPLFNSGGRANGIDGGIQRVHAPRPQPSILQTPVARTARKLIRQLSGIAGREEDSQASEAPPLHHQQSFVQREITSRSGTQDFGTTNGYTRCIGVKETPHSRERKVGSSSTRPLIAGYHLGNHFDVPVTYQSTLITHNGTAPTLINGKSSVNNKQFKPSPVSPDSTSPSTALRTLFEVPLPSYNFATQTFEHRIVNPKISAKNTSSTHAIKPTASEPIAMSKIVHTHPPVSESGADAGQSVAPQNDGGRKTTPKPRTPKKRTPKKADVLPHSHYTDSIDRVIKLACGQGDNCTVQNIQHPQRPASTMPCETAATADITRQRTRHRSTDADVVPKKARKKHTKTDTSKSRVEHFVPVDTSHSTTLVTRRVTGQYPQRIIITSKPLHAVVKQKLATVENSKPPTVKTLPRHENLRSCLLSNGSSVPSKASVSAPVPSYYPEAMHTYGPQVFAVDSVLPSTGPFLPDYQSSIASATHSTGDPPSDQPLDYSMKTLRKLEETKPIMQPEVIDLSLPKREPPIAVEKSTATAVIKPRQFYLPPVMPDDALRTSSTQQTAMSPFVTSVSQPPRVTEAAVSMPPIPQKAASTGMVNPYAMIAPAVAVCNQIDTSNLDTLCDVALASTQGSPVNAKGCKKGQRNSRKKQSSQNSKKVDNLSAPKTPRKKSKSAGRKKDEKQAYVAKLVPGEPSLLINHTSDILPNNVEVFRQTAKPVDPPTNIQTVESIVLTAGVDEVEISDDARSDTTLDANERPDTTIFTNEMNVCPSENDHSPAAPDITSDVRCETEQKEFVQRSDESNAELGEKTVDPVPEVKRNCDTIVIAEKKDTVVTDVRENTEALHSEKKHHENVSSSNVTENLEKAFVEAGTTEMKKIQRSSCQASRSSPNVTIQRLNSNEMRNNFSVSSQDGVILIRPESLDSIMKPRTSIKTEPSSQGAINENQTVFVEKDEGEIPRVMDDSEKPIAERASLKLDAYEEKSCESSEVAAILKSDKSSGKKSSTRIKSESEEVPFLPRFSCHSPIDLNEACCDEYDNMCQVLDAGSDDDCLEIVENSLDRPTVAVETSEIVPEAETATDLSESVKETEIIFSPITTDEVADEGVIQGENIGENPLKKSESLKKRKKRRRFRLTWTKKKAIPVKQSSTEENKVLNQEACKQPREGEEARSEVTPDINEECVSDNGSAVISGPIAHQPSPDDSEIKPEIQSTMENSMVSSIISPTNASKDSDVSPHKRKSLKLGYSLNSEFGIGEVIPKRRKLIKKDEKPVLIIKPNPPVVVNAKPICLIDSSESSDDESNIFKTEKAKQLVKKSHIQQKIAFQESQKILKKAKDYMVKKEPNRLAKKGLLKSTSSGKSKSTSKSSTKSPATVQSTPDKTTEMQATDPSLSVDVDRAVTPNDSSRESSRSPYLRPNGSRYVLSRGCGPWLVTRRETQLVQGSPQKINTPINRKDNAESKEVKASPTSDDSDSPKSSIRLKSFVRDPKEPEVNCKLSDEPQWNSNCEILNQTVANKSLEKKLDDADGKRKNLLGIKSLFPAKAAPTTSKLKAAVSCMSKLDMKASKENFDPDQVIQVTYNQSSEYIVGSEAGKLAVETHDRSTFPFAISPHESYGEEEEPQPFILTTFAKDALLKDKNKEQSIENSVIPNGASHILEIQQAVDEPESLSVIPEEGNPAQTTDNDSASRQISTDDRNFNEADSQATRNTSELVSGDAKLLSLVRLLPPPPLKEECTSPPSTSANRVHGTADIYSVSSLHQNRDVTLARPLNRASSNVNNNNVIHSLQMPSKTETLTHQKTVSNITEDCTARVNKESTSNDSIAVNKNLKARMKGKWSSRDFIPPTNAKRPSYFSQVKMSKAKRDEKVYQVMQKMLNMGLIVDKSGRKPSDMARWPTSFDKYSTGETSRCSAPLPAWSKPGKSVKREFISEEDVIVIKPCTVSLRRLDF